MRSRRISSFFPTHQSSLCRQNYMRNSRESKASLLIQHFLIVFPPNLLSYFLKMTQIKISLHSIMLLTNSFLFHLKLQSQDPCQRNKLPSCVARRYKVWSTSTPWGKCTEISKEPTSSSPTEEKSNWPISAFQRKLQLPWAKESPSLALRTGWRRR